MSEPPWRTIATLHFQSDGWVHKPYENRFLLKCLGSTVTSRANECPGCVSIEDGEFFTTVDEAAKWYCKFYKLGPYAIHEDK